MNSNEESSNGVPPNGVPPNGVPHEHLTVKLGRRKTDVSIILEWAVKRGLIKCNVAYVEGVYLEEIPTRLIPKSTDRIVVKGIRVVYEKIQMGIVLVKRDWGSKLYFMNERQDWEEDDYFQAADLLINNIKDNIENADE